MLTRSIQRSPFLGFIFHILVSILLSLILKEDRKCEQDNHIKHVAENLTKKKDKKKKKTPSNNETKPKLVIEKHE